MEPAARSAPAPAGTCAGRRLRPDRAAVECLVACGCYRRVRAVATLSTQRDAGSTLQQQRAQVVLRHKVTLCRGRAQ